MNGEKIQNTQPTIQEHLNSFQELNARGEMVKHEYWRPIHQTWSAMDREEQLIFVSRLQPNDAADFLRMMIGERSHSHQPQNRLTWPIFEIVLNSVPEAFMIIEENKLPSWIDIISRFNIHEDGSFDKALGIIKQNFYSEPEDANWWPFHQDRARAKARSEL